MYIRNIAKSDWLSIMALQHQAYYHFDPESELVLKSKSVMGDNLCFVAESKETLVGYLIAFSYPMKQYPSLVKPESTPYDCSNLLLHDLVVDKNFRLEGIATALISVLCDVAREQGFKTLSLISSESSRSFWMKKGFSMTPDTIAPIHYGQGATYLSIQLNEDAR